MTRIFSIAGNDSLVVQLDQLIAGSGNQIYWVMNEAKLFEQLQPDTANIVLLPNTTSLDVYRVSETISQRFPMTSVILLFQSEQELDMRRAIRAGVADVIFLSSPAEKIKEDLKQAIATSEKKSFHQQESGPVKNGKVITIASTKGGSGKTTLAVNLAASFGKKIASVAVVDLNLQFGDVAMFTDIKPKLTIYDWVKEDRDGAHIGKFMTDYKDGISVLAAPQRPEFAEMISGDHVRKAIQTLKKQYDVVIIDTPASMDENTIVALENADDILVMTYLDLPTLKNSRMLLDTLESLQIGERAKVVVNRQMKVKGLTVETLEKVVGRNVFATIPAMDKAMITATNEGKPINYSSPRSQVAKRIFQMAEDLYQPTASVPDKKKKRKKKQMVSAGGHA